ncbi:uncharacterized protein LOC124484107 isoform X1 [Hypomesus transpacificus]|uniref:uncharacterized protein LOC124484107 isoform X1 n=1 Tax=Hypomesus transpacificus TaxID=137520 RepID=UPI001F082C26|nr:uncharacterized protein LOC124484107 isoform X1 [Hypomesus transpacificus]
MSFNGAVDGDIVTETCVKDLLLCQSASDLEMDRLCLCVALTALFCAASCGETGVSGAEVEQRVTPGDKVTLHCDCRASSGVHVAWYRNCSHRNQPTLVMSTYNNNKNNMFLQYDQLFNPFPGFTLVWNKSNNTFDLLIENVTESDLGLYYCGTEEKKVVETDKIKEEMIYLYGNITISLSFVPEPAPSGPACHPDPEKDLYWILLLTLCPGSALLSSILSSILVYHYCCRTTASNEPQGDCRTDTRRRESRVQQEGDQCYAALDFPQGQRIPQKKRRTQSSDFSTYSAIKTSGV